MTRSIAASTFWGMSRRFSILLALGLVLGCGDGREASPPDSPAGDAADSDTTTAARADSTRLVVVAGPLRIEPAGDAEAVTDVAVGTTLRVVGDTTVGAGRWVRLATWDDRKGWMPERSVLDPALWTHYAEALGGVAVVALRPAYPVGEGRWAAEAPFPSPDFDLPAEAWLARDSLLSTHVTERDTMRVECTGARHSLVLLDRADRTGARRGARLEEGSLAIPSARRPSARSLAIGDLDPEPDLREAVETAARSAIEAGPRGGVSDDGDTPPPDPTDPSRFDWRSVGSDAAWAAVSWNPFEGREAEITPGRWGAAFLAVRGESGWTVRTVLPLDWAFVGPDAPPWRLLSAVATVPGRPTLLAIEALEYEGARIDLYLADDTGFRRFYRGYYWGC
ncbi:MAG: SH3 domain-containing protein [Gemmatimonadota bacterium]|nr:SH3 domain-containing protein [Gemmatimonadota bacterium]